MSKNIHNLKLSEKINSLLQNSLADIVPDARPLLAALILSSSDEYRILQAIYHSDPLINIIINNAKHFNLDKNLFKLYAKDGFFTEQLELMLAIAKSEPESGARLVPVFLSAIERAEELCLPAALVDRLHRYIERRRSMDGFIIRFCESGYTVDLADSAKKRCN
ncbi:MAG: hypothetical protein IKM31_07455 [Oscillospiraceae bacterium]|nr:hypothetical protein [Oscillospiraceae bacterium]